jgi:phosphatidylinositol glycan class Q protein
MTRQVYFPHDLVKRLQRARDPSACRWLIGYRLAEIEVVIDMAAAAGGAAGVADALGIDRAVQAAAVEGLQVLGTVNGHGKLRLSYSAAFSLPVVEGDAATTFVVFHAPNYKNLEYLSIRPILLQSGGHEPPEAPRLIAANYAALGAPHRAPFDNAVVDRMNQCGEVRAKLKRASPRKDRPRGRLARTAAAVAAASSATAVCLLRLISPLAPFSALLRQLQLRLMQVNYLPVQFLGYCDSATLDSAGALDLPISNSNLNINNSNYISFYNLAWLILNDVLVGLSVQALVAAHYAAIARFVNEVTLKRVLFDELQRAITWVSYHHPAGFKLNNELGLFMGDLFLWLLRFWKLLCLDVLSIGGVARNSGDSAATATVAAAAAAAAHSGTAWLRPLVTLACGAGFSFLVALTIDYIQLISFHVGCFHYALAKIFLRQVAILQSLLQLFCGKKYNVLRHRIDNLDNYLPLGGAYEVDQLLLGTLIFVVLVLLLPTVFAFYLMFFLARLACLSLVYVAECTLLVVNCTPLFVVLLKLKNLRRLQGGLQFRYLGARGRATYLLLDNKLLTYHEIFGHFGQLFRTLRQSTVVAILQQFARGSPLVLVQQHDHQRCYLMLPRNYAHTVAVLRQWRRGEPTHR